MKILENLLSQQERDSIFNWWSEYENKPDDHQAIGTKAIRQPEFLTPYLTKVKPLLEKETGFNLTNKFSAIRMYHKGDKLKKHVDNAAEFAISNKSASPLVSFSCNSGSCSTLSINALRVFSGMKI